MSPRGTAIFCKAGDDLLSVLRSPAALRSTWLRAFLIILAGSMCYGAAFGAWRSWLQASYAALKMPLFIFATVAASATINTMLAYRLGARLTFPQVLALMLIAFAIISALLGALAPIVLFFSLTVPDRTSPEAMAVYRAVLIANTAAVGLCGIAGNLRLYSMMEELIGNRTVARRVLVAWILISGLAGCEFSWLASPFLARPDIPVPLLNPNAFKSNFFEYLWRAANGSF